MGSIETAPRGSRLRKVNSRWSGFTLIEVMIAAVILIVGLLSLAALFAKALGAVQFSQEGQIARQKSREALESIYTARNDASITFDQLQNDADGGIFKSGFQTMYLPGSNGIPGTDKDTAILDRVILPGKNGVIETASNAAAPAGDDVFMPLTNFQRQILINNVVDGNGNVNLYMRRITVTIRTNAGGINARDYVTTGYISNTQQ